MGIHLIGAVDRGHVEVELITFRILRFFIFLQPLLDSAVEANSNISLGERQKITSP